jgi:hypothetical protein
MKHLAIPGCCLLLALTLATGAAALAQEEGDAAPAPNNRKQIVTKDQTKEFTEAFLKVLVNGRPFDAFSLMKAAMPDNDNDVDATRASTEELLQQVRPAYGKAIGYEMVDSKSVGASLVRYDYLMKFEKNALHCRIIYYKPVNNWIPLRIWFDDNLHDLIEDLGK